MYYWMYSSLSTVSLKLLIYITSKPDQPKCLGYRAGWDANSFVGPYTFVYVWNYIYIYMYVFEWHVISPRYNDEGSGIISWWMSRTLISYKSGYRAVLADVAFTGLVWLRLGHSLIITPIASPLTQLNILHGWVISSHCFICMNSLIHARISMRVFLISVRKIGASC